MRKLLGVFALVLVGSAAWGEMYTWKDRHGTAFYTNSIHEIPARYLKKARVLDVATGKKGGLVTQAAAPAASAPQGQGQAPAPASPVATPITPPYPPSPAAPLTAATGDPAAGSPPRQLPVPAAVAAPPVQGRVVLPRRPHRHPRGEEQ